MGLGLETRPLEIQQISEWQYVYNVQAATALWLNATPKEINRPLLKAIAGSSLRFAPALHKRARRIMRWFTIFVVPKESVHCGKRPPGEFVAGFGTVSHSKIILPQVKPIMEEPVSDSLSIGSKRIERACSRA